MHPKHTSESHKAPIFGPGVICESPVFQRRRVSTRAKKRPFMKLSSMFAQLHRVGRAKWFTRKGLRIGPPAQSAIQNSIDLRHLYRPLHAAAERQPVPEWIGDRHLARLPRRGLDTRPSVLVSLRQKLLLELLDTNCFNPHVHARRAVAEMF